MGVTDIDDKIIMRAAEKGINFRELSKFYEDEFFNDLEMLNVTMPHLSCRVTEYIPQIIQFIANILAKNKAYVAKDGKFLLLLYAYLYNTYFLILHII